MAEYEINYYDSEGIYQTQRVYASSEDDAIEELCNNFNVEEIIDYYEID